MINNKKPQNPTIAQGWTLRDEFANSAISKLTIILKPKNFYDSVKLFLRSFGCENTVRFQRNFDLKGDPEFCYLLADAMLKQRELNNENS